MLHLIERKKLKFRAKVTVRDAVCTVAEVRRDRNTKEQVVPPTTLCVILVSIFSPNNVSKTKQYELLKP